MPDNTRSLTKELRKFKPSLFFLFFFFPRLEFNKEEAGDDNVERMCKNFLYDEITRPSL